jgi:predicted glycogen debranching enzyme
VNFEEPAISLDRTICTDLTAARQREWLVTNGIGGYAMGTVAGILTRSYHGLLIGALKPPLGRTLLCSKLEETVTYQGNAFELFSNSWRPNEVTPDGYKYIDHFRLEGTTPVWTFTLGGAQLEKLIWMQPGENTTHVRYTVLHAEETLTLDIKALANYRDHHARMLDTTLSMQVEEVEQGVKIIPPGEGAPFYILCTTGTVTPQHTWHESLFLDTEAKRGLGSYENDLLVGTLHVRLEPGSSLDIIISSEQDVRPGRTQQYQEHLQYERELIANSPLSQTPAEIRQLVLAADQFVVRRKTPDNPEGRSIIAGYPWFGDWGRDTMISLPGLTLETGRSGIAAEILRTFAHFVDQGMLPNRFPDAGEIPEYNTVDATLWYFQAIQAYYNTTGDLSLIRELYPVLADIIAWHRKGTRHQIHVDPVDTLLYAGEPGTQLTWMDAKYGDWVVTPRIGKPVEVNALWFNALKSMAGLARELHHVQDAHTYEAQAARVAQSFARFWNQSADYCYDVLDGPEGNEALLRPNQLFAVSLPHSPLHKTQQKAVVDACSQSLLTPYGLRSLAPDQPGYIGRYEGSTEQRDTAYHRGTVWAWLMGAFVEAHLRVYHDPNRARSFLEPLIQQHLCDYGLGSVSEIFDGDMPYTAGGCPEQAWSVAELLRAWRLTTRKHTETPRQQN